MYRGAHRNRSPPLTYDVLILGYGPVGQTAAALLAANGLRIAVVEQSSTIYDKPRAISLDHEVMRVFQACGVAHDIEPFIAPHAGHDYLGVDGRVIRTLDPMEPPYPLGWWPSIAFVQPELEAVLRSRVAQYESVNVFLANQVVAFEQDGDGVDVTVRDLENGTEQVLRAGYLLACDGANSFVRKRLGIGLEDLAFDEWWMVVDARLKRPTDLPSKGVQYCWPSRPATFVVGPGNLRRWEIKILPGEDPRYFDEPENITEKLARFVDTSAIEIWRSAVYRFHALLAERWRQERVFLLGDACHQTPPFLGQGMCAGIRDAANLAWKLSMVIQANASDALLDTYELERKPHVRDLVGAAKSLGQIVGELDPELARKRDIRLRGQLKRGEVETTRQKFIPDLKDGVIDGENAGGTLFVQPHVTTDGSQFVLLDDLLKGRFLLATTSSETQGWLSSRSLAIWNRIGGEHAVIRPKHQDAGKVAADVLVLTERDELFAQWMHRHSCAAAIVRPDRYVFGVAADAIGLNCLIDLLENQMFWRCYRPA